MIKVYDNVFYMLVLIFILKSDRVRYNSNRIIESLEKLIS